MEKKEATKKDSIEYLLKRILRSRHGGGSNTSFVDAPIELSASPEEGSVYKRVHPYQAARVACRYYQARDPNGRRSFDDTSPELDCVGAPDPGLYIFLLSRNS